MKKILAFVFTGSLFILCAGCSAFFFELWLLPEDDFEPVPLPEAAVAAIADAPHYTETRQWHPSRRMYPSERDAWILIYHELGGKNAQEIEMFEIVNEIRASYDLPPFILCARLSMAARLFSYLQVKYHTIGHIDPYYDCLMSRMNFFGARGTIYMENANSERWYEFPGGRREYIYLSPQELVAGWMESESHRAHILTTQTTHAGFGLDSGRNRAVPTMKTIMPR